MKLRYPKIIGFPLTTRCGLECDYCSRKSLLKSKVIVPNQDISWSLLDRIITNSGGTKKINISSGFGEPLLYPKFIPLLRKLQKKKKEVILFSNGNVIDNSKIEEIAKSVKRIVISLDYGEKKKYEKIRKNAHFEKVVLFVKLLNLYKEKHNSKIEIIISKVFLKKDSFEDLRKIIQLTHDLGVFNLEIRDCYPFSSTSNFNKIISGKELNLLKKKARLLDVNLIVPKIKKVKSCSEIRDNLYLTIDGHVQSCCFDPLTKMKESIFQNTCVELFNSTNLKTLRRKFSLRQVPPNCLVCPLFYTK